MTEQKTKCFFWAVFSLAFLSSLLVASQGFCEKNDYKKKIEEKLRILKFSVLERQASLEAENENLAQENQQLKDKLADPLINQPQNKKRRLTAKEKEQRKDQIEKLTQRIAELQHSLMEKDVMILQLNALTDRQEQDIAALKKRAQEQNPTQAALTEALLGHNGFSPEMENEVAQLTAEVIMDKKRFQRS